MQNDLRQSAVQSGMLETGVDRIISQVVDLKLNYIFTPQVSGSPEEESYASTSSRDWQSGPSSSGLRCFLRIWLIPSESSFNEEMAQLTQPWLPVIVRIWPWVRSKSHSRTCSRVLPTSCCHLTCLSMRWHRVDTAEEETLQQPGVLLKQIILEHCYHMWR